MPETALKRCAVCQNFAHCTAAGYCNCGAYGARQETAEDMVPVLRKTWDALQVRSYEIAERLDNAERRLRQLGYERCSSIACNCKGYHFNGRD